MRIIKLLIFKHMKGKYLPFLVLPMFLFAFLLLSPLSVSAVVEEEEVWVDTSACIATVCGTTLGTKSQALYEEECEWVCPTIEFEWEVTEYLPCPEGYKAQKDVCRYKSETIAREFNVIPMSAHVLYEKSKDPNKCHRPSDKTLETFYEMSREAIGAFKKENPQNRDAEYVCEDVLIDTKTVSCNNATPFACPVDQEEPGDVSGVTDKAEVKAATTEVVLAETGASSNLFVYLVQAVLMLSTLVSGTLFTKKYIM
jgi:hypothetical protein